MHRNWEEKVKEYCEKYNIPLIYLAETLYEPKVVPMAKKFLQGVHRSAAKRWPLAPNLLMQIKSGADFAATLLK